MKFRQFIGIALSVIRSYQTIHISTLNYPENPDSSKFIISVNTH